MIVELLVACIVGYLSYYLYKCFTDDEKSPYSAQSYGGAQSFGGSSSTSSSNSSSNSMNDKYESDSSNFSSDGAKPLTVLYGSQSGTGESFAREFAKQAVANGFQAKVIDLEEYDKEKMLSKEKFVVFFMSTFGEGEPTDSATEFFNWFMEDDRSDDTSLNGLPYAVFALGNRQYEHFCGVGKKVDNRLETLGGKRIHEVGLGDDDGSIEDDYRTWRTSFWKAARKHFGAEGGEVESKGFEPSFDIRFMESGSYTGGLTHFLNDEKNKAGLAKVVINRELRQCTKEGASARHIELDLSGTGLTYQTADNLGIYPRNCPKMAADFAKRLGVKMNQQFFLTANNPEAKKILPNPCSVEDALLYYCDINSVCRLSLLEILAQYTTDESEKAKMAHYAAAGKEMFLAEEKSIIEIFDEFSNIIPPFNHFLEWCPKIAPRLYTISSSKLPNPNQVAVTVSLTYHSKGKNGNRKHRGLASGYLIDSSIGDKFAVFIRASTFRFPRSYPASRLQPIIMFGPGTGIAPFRACLQECSWMAEKGEKTGRLILFFGCQHPERDYIYRDEIETAQKNGVLTDYYCAFSRHTNQKVYVQDLLKQNGETIWQLIEKQNASIFVCGGTAMGRGVKDGLIELAQKHGKLSPARAANQIKHLQTLGRFIQELWS